ncbi:MAG: bacillithiol biosynthesis cysteine-adding enzyme BshC [Calditrichia bacterium]
MVLDNLIMHLQTVSTQIPEPNPFFNAFLYDFAKVSSFFQWNPRENFELCLSSRLENFTLRNVIPEILEEQNRQWDAPKTVLEQINLLRNDKTLAVVTGQQVGLFTGPLYTVYKAISAIHYCKLLQKKYPEYNFVPVFWMEANDHDFEEINHCFLPDPGDRPVKFEIPSEEQNRQSVYRLQIAESIVELIHQMEKALPATEFRGEILSQLRQIYDSGGSYVRAFAKHLTTLLGEYGLIICDPSDPALKILALPVFRKILDNPDMLSQSVQADGELLRQKGFSPALNLPDHTTGIFVEDDSRRRVRLDYESGRFFLKDSGASQEISRQILMEWLEKSPERFSPNVALRPIIQDLVFPTAVYIGGPGEMSYLAQLNSLYRKMQVCQPAFLARARATIVEKKVNRLIQKYGLTFEEIFRGNSNVVEKYLTGQAEPEVFHRLNSLGKVVENEFKKLQVSLIALEPTLQSPVDKTLKNTLRSLEQLKSKVENALKNRNKVEIEQINRIFNLLMPNQQYQERVYNIIYFQVKYGPDFIGKLFEALNCEIPEHQLLIME